MWQAIAVIVIAGIILFALQTTLKPILDSILVLVLRTWYRLLIRKHKKNTIGIIVAVKTEVPSEENRLRNDLLAELHEGFANATSSDLFSLIECPQLLCKTITDIRSARKYMFDMRGHLIVYGSLVIRKTGGIVSHVFKLHGVVRHSPMSPELSYKISKEFRKFLPEMVTFSEDEEVLGFELTRNKLSVVIPYVVGLAAFSSRDPFLSGRIFQDLYDKLNQIQPDKQSTSLISDLITRLRSQLIDIMIAHIGMRYDAFVSSEEIQYILACKPYLDRLDDLDPANYKGLLIKAIILFFEGNLDSAIELLEPSVSKDRTWRLSLGFLFAYKGDIEGALNQYQKAFYSEFPENVANDVEVFVSMIVRNEPHRVQLLFFRGLINHKFRNDDLLAKRDFLLFLEKPESSQYSQLTKLAKNYLLKIR